MQARLPIPELAGWISSDDFVFLLQELLMILTIDDLQRRGMKVIDSPSPHQIIHLACIPALLRLGSMPVEASRESSQCSDRLWQ